MPTPFLTAEWRSLAMLNYEIDPAVLLPFVPSGTELDQWQRKTYVSMIGFMFLKTRVLGISIPFLTDFEEVNLRFYVRRLSPDGWRRGVVFIKELVPSMAIAWTARVFYNENYVALPMTHRIDAAGADQHVSYGWDSNFEDRLNYLELTTTGTPAETAPGSCEEFITEHYWGYARQRDGGTVEYQVEHPRWRVWAARESKFECDVAALYGKSFARFLAPKPASAFLADGSAVTVFKGTRLAVN
jgi:uncharacterized protein YqjF (DUF2071 family)